MDLCSNWIPQRFSSNIRVDALERRVQHVDRQAVQAEERSELERAALKAEVRKLRTRFKEADERCAALEATRKKSEGLVVRATQEASSLSERLQTVEAQIEERSRVIEQLKEDAQTWEARATAAEAAAPPHEERELEQEALEALRSTATEDAQARLMAERERDAALLAAAIAGDRAAAPAPCSTTAGGSPATGHNVRACVARGAYGSASLVPPWPAILRARRRI